MNTLYALAAVLNSLAAQVSSTAGTQLAQHGAKQRLQEPNYYDAAFPVIAFCLVIVVPSSVALWVIFKTISEKTMEADET